MFGTRCHRVSPTIVQHGIQPGPPSAPRRPARARFRPAALRRLSWCHRRFGFPQSRIAALRGCCQQAGPYHVHPSAVSQRFAQLPCGDELYRRTCPDQGHRGLSRDTEKAQLSAPALGRHDCWHAHFSCFSANPRLSAPGPAGPQGTLGRLPGIRPGRQIGPLARPGMVPWRRKTGGKTARPETSVLGNYTYGQFG